LDDYDSDNLERVEVDMSGVPMWKPMLHLMKQNTILALINEKQQDITYWHGYIQRTRGLALGTIIGLLLWIPIIGIAIWIL